MTANLPCKFAMLFNNPSLFSDNPALIFNNLPLPFNNPALLAASEILAEKNIPALGRKYSHLGNKMFPHWE